MRPWIALVAMAALVAVGTALGGPRRWEGAALRLLEHLPADPACGRPIAQLAALAQGQALPADPCLAELGTAPLAAPLLARLVDATGRPVEARLSAFAALRAGGRLDEVHLGRLVFAPQPPPALRRAALEAAVAGNAAVDWAERGEAVAIHGLYDRSIAAFAAWGEPGAGLRLRGVLAASPPGGADAGVLRGAQAALGLRPGQLEAAVERLGRGQLPLGFPPRWQGALWGAACAPDCAPLLARLLGAEAELAGDVPLDAAGALPVADDVVEALYDGDAAAHVRAELHAVAGWIGQRDASRRLARLVAAVLAPGADPVTPDEALRDAGDVHAVLRRGGGSPGATALAVTDLALATGIPVTSWATPEGAAVQVGGSLYTLAACRPAERGAQPQPDWREVPLGGVDALVLVERAARALREGDAAVAARRLAAARVAWPDAPGLDGVEASILAAQGPPPPPLPPAPARATRRGGRRVAPQLEAAPPTPPAAPTEPPIGWEVLSGSRGTGALFVVQPTMSPTRRGGRRPSAPVGPTDPTPPGRAALEAHTARVRALARAPADALLASWWAHHAGHLELARALLMVAGEPGGLPAELRPLRSTVARALGEPSAAVVPQEPPCPGAYRADPPADAWRGATDARPVGSTER